jgi:signal transduction histidine kinase
MRRRIAWATVTVAITGILVLGVPLVFVARQVVRNDELRRLDREASAIAFAIDDDFEHQRAIDHDLLTTLGGRERYILVREASGNVARGGPHIAGDTLSTTLPVERHGSVTVTISARDTNRRVVTAVFVIVGLSALGVIAAIGLAIVVARRLGRPVADLARVSARLGAGDFSARAPRSGVPELDLVADALDQSATRIDELVRTEREFATNASHQLRTPITALRLRLEELTTVSDPDIRREAEAALVQADRLGTTIEELLALARSHAGVARQPVDVAALVRERATSWQGNARRAHRTVEVDAGEACVVEASASALSQAIDALIENSLAHGRGVVRVAVRPHPQHVEITVEDEGAGIPPDAVASIFERHVSLRGGTGVGLALARSLVEASGGRLDLERPSPPRFRVLLPMQPVDDGVTPRGGAAREVAG